jgi:hypothetical protein
MARVAPTKGVSMYCGSQLLFNSLLPTYQARERIERTCPPRAPASTMIRIKRASSEIEKDQIKKLACDSWLAEPLVAAEEGQH